MKSILKVVLWMSVGFVALLGGMSICGAFMGATRAKSFFNSPALAVFWVLLTLLLISGFVLFKRLRTSLGLLFAHLGPILILAGAMFGSRIGYNFATKHLGETRVESGLMKIIETPPGAELAAQAVSDVLDPEGKKVIWRLPFALALAKFRIEYHDRWRLGIEAPPAGSSHERRAEEIKWELGKEVEIPLIGGTVKVLQYLDHAQRDIGSAEDFKLEVTDADGRKTVVAAKLEQTVEVANPKGMLTITEVFTHLVTQKHGNKYHSVNVPGSHENPALRLMFTAADGKKSQMWAFRAEANYQHGVGNMKAVYIVTPPRVVKGVDTLLPAMEVLISRNGRDVTTWLVAKATLDATGFALPDELAPAPSGPAHEGHGHGKQTFLVLARPTMPKQYYSHLTVLEEGKEVLAKKIWVNNPLHYGGYHFYQSSYGSNRRMHTVLQVKYDAGLWPVYAGLFLLCAGPFWLFWFKPAWNYLKKRQVHVQ